MSEPDVIRIAQGPADIGSARRLFDEYAASLGVDLGFQGFAAELAGLPGDYAPPRGRLLLARRGSADIGCVALRPLHGGGELQGDGGELQGDGGELQGDGGGPRRGVAEVKRLYLRPVARGSGLGRALMEAVLGEARAIGYRELRLDTLATMREARALYASLGFRECEPYCESPLRGTSWMSLALR